MSEAPIKIISEQGIWHYKAQNINKTMAGQKAMGLLEIPVAWRLPFFVISKAVIQKGISIDDEQKENFCMEISKRIEKCVKDYAMPTQRIIIRSSGEEEGMNERGRYESYVCGINEIHGAFIRILENLRNQHEKPIAYIVQPYVERKILGHLSNERRISQYPRDWKVEYEGLGKEPYSIGIRKWRKTYDGNDLKKDPLQCTDEKSIKQELRKIAYYYTEIEKKQRVHFEFVWDGKRIYLVQKDIEILDLEAQNPMEYNIEVNNVDEFDSMQVFRRIEQRDGMCFKKVKNVLLYEQVGLITAPLYILDNKQIITDMSNGIFDEAVKHDLCLFDGKSVVIRTDVETDTNDIVRLLPRSNELRSYEDIAKWCKESLRLIVEYENIALLIHIFIPAISAAFAYAEPNSRVVTIQSLWGLPEGLYYNAHDTFLLDTGAKDIGHIEEDKVMINSVVTDFKSVYISPDCDGKWTEKKTMPPYDWKKSITNKQAKRIAIGSRMIAQKVNEPVSIMWFVGIDKDYYKTDCLPWFHEIYGNNTFSHEIYKKKYYTEKEVVISTEEDLRKYEDDKNLRTITIHPKDDRTLRNRAFIDKVGDFARDRGITIFLEGTILAHPVYALISKGVRIILAKKNKELIEKNNFDKLVRDKIPNKIVGNMEQIKCYKAKENILIRYLQEKLVEETFEVCDAQIEEELLEEMADVYEVLLALQNHVLGEFDYKNVRREKKLRKGDKGDKIVSIREKNLMEEFFEEHCNCAYGWVNFCVERERQCIELEITITENEMVCYDTVKNECAWKYKLQSLAYQILDSKSKNVLEDKCKEYVFCLEEKIKEMGFSIENFNSIREKKNKKNGSFDNGFVLHETQMNTNTSKDNFDMNLPVYEEDMQEEYPELLELLFDSVTYVDYRENFGKELIIRIKYPLCLNSWQNEFSGKNIEAIFGQGSRLMINAERDETKYSFSLYIWKQCYEQLAFTVN